MSMTSQGQRGIVYQGEDLPAWPSLFRSFAPRPAAELTCHTEPGAIPHRRSTMFMVFLHSMRIRQFRDHSDEARIVTGLDADAEQPRDLLPPTTALRAARIFRQYSPSFQYHVFHILLTVCQMLFHSARSSDAGILRELDLYYRPWRFDCPCLAAALSQFYARRQCYAS